MSRHLAVAAFAGVVAGAGCEYRDHATELTLDKACYELRADSPTTLYAQARGEDDRPIDGVAISWLITPSSLAITAESSTTGPGQVGGLWAHGIASVTASIAPELAPPTEGLLVATAAIDGAVLSARAEVRLPEVEGGARCPAEAEVDAGLDATDVDASEVAIDASEVAIDAP